VCLFCEARVSRGFGGKAGLACRPLPSRGLRLYMHYTAERQVCVTFMRGRERPAGAFPLLLCPWCMEVLVVHGSAHGAAALMVHIAHMVHGSV